MAVEGISEMKSLLSELLPREGRINTPVKGVDLFRRDHSYKPKPAIYNPQIIILAQGKKNVSLGEQTYTYDSRHYFVQTVPLPVVCEALIEEGKPMMGVVLEIDPKVIGEILFEMNKGPRNLSRLRNGMYDAETTGDLIDSVLRLLKTFKSEPEMRVLGPLYYKEILFKVLNGDKGAILEDLIHSDSTYYQIVNIINNMHRNFSDPLEVQDLAKEAGMSLSSFHTRFKAVTCTTPLQYIKNIRLHKAKELIQQEGEKAYAAAMRVGYESSSQFNREYKRFFGVTPARDNLVNHN